MLLFILIVLFLYLILYPREIISRIRPYGTLYGIPKIIWRCSIHSDSLYISSIRYKYCYEDWNSLNGDFTHLWCNDITCNSLMKQFGERIYNAYDKLIPGAYKADLWRICVLYKYGGVYVDGCSRPYVKLTDIFKNGLVTVKDPYPDCIHNGFIISPPGHPILKAYIDDIVLNIEKERYGLSIFDITGPKQFSLSIKRFFGKTKYTHRRGWNFRESQYPYYLLKLNYSIYQSIYDRTTRVLDKKYSFIHYLLQLMDFGRYHILWEQRKVFKKRQT